MIFNDFLHCSNRKHKILSNSINEHNFLLLSFMFSFTHTFATLVNILKDTVRVLTMLGWAKINEEFQESPNFKKVPSTNSKVTPGF
jgi:hypothetical protein